VNTVIGALPASGGEAYFSQCGTYKFTGTANLGNGTSSTASTRSGIVIRGVGNNRVGPAFPGFNATPCVKILWAGSGAGGVFSVNGPLQTWSLQNLDIDCNSVASSVGLQVVSAQFGDNRNLTFNNCFRSILSTTVAPFGSFTNTDSFHNDYYGTVIQMPAIAGTTGIFLTGVAAGTSNTDYNTFIDTWIALTNTNVLAQATVLQSSDTNHFITAHLSGGSASAQCVAFDYSLVSTFPSSNRFTGVDTSGTCGGGAGSTIGGTPAAGAKPNIVFPDGANNTTCANFALANVSCFSATELYTNPGGNNVGTNVLGAWATFAPSAACGTATFTTNTGRRLTAGKNTYLSLNIAINALGTCGGANPFTFTLPVANQSFGSIAGNNTNTGQGFTCRMTGTATATCNLTAGAAFAAGDNLIASGVYENQ
jgi:hypothetical protein